MRRIAAASLALAIAFSGLALAPAAGPQHAAAASCVRFVASNFDAPGNDNYAAYLNGEWVRIKNFCSIGKSLSGWRIHDYRSNHTYNFPTGFRIGAGLSVTLYSGRGTNTRTKLFWKYRYGAVWNNTAPEYASLRKDNGTLASKWTEY